MAKGGIKIEMTKEKDCKGSMKYSTQDPNAIVDNVYVSRKAADPMPDKVTITVELG